MTERNKYRLEVAIDRAFEEFLALETDRQTPINIMLLARKYAPSTKAQVLDCLDEHGWLFFMEAKAGMLILDVVIASVTTYIAAALNLKFDQFITDQQMKGARNKIIVPGK